MSKMRVWLIDGDTNGQTLNTIELMQFTGLLDKNGKEIYEGDIIRVSVSAPWDEEVPIDITGTITFENNAWWFTGKQTNNWDGYLDFEKPEIIGNIYENPELLKEAA